MDSTGRSGQQEVEEPEGDIGSHHSLELGTLGGQQSLMAHGCALLGSGRVHLWQDQQGGQQHPEVGTDRVEGLREVETPCGVVLRPHGHHERVSAGLQNGQAGGQGEQGGQKYRVCHDVRRGDEQKPTGSRQHQPDQDTALVAQAAVDEGRGDRQTEVGAVVGGLHQGGLQVRHGEHGAEHLDQGIGHVSGQAPGGEAGDQQAEGHHHAGVQEPSVGWGLLDEVRLSHGVLDGSHHSTPFLRMRFPYRAVSPVTTTA